MEVEKKDEIGHINRWVKGDLQIPELTEGYRKAITENFKEIQISDHPRYKLLENLKRSGFFEYRCRNAKIHYLAYIFMFAVDMFKKDLLDNTSFKLMIKGWGFETDMRLIKDWETLDFEKDIYELYKMIIDEGRFMMKDFINEEISDDAVKDFFISFTDKEEEEFIISE